MTAFGQRLRKALEPRYTIRQQIGRGGMATVFMAEDQRHDRAVAVKVLDPVLSRTLESARFSREIQILAQLNHPNILTLIDSGSADGLFYYVTPYIEGESLRTRLDRDHQLSVAESIRIAREVADGLAYAHRHGIVHRDIKPDNILLCEGHALIADFGIASVFVEAENERVTRTGVSVGSPHYMSPEQAVGDEATDGRSDIYSLACLTYEMLAGVPPFSGPSAKSILARHLTASPTPLVDVCERVPRGLSKAIARALEKEPGDRYSTATEFSEALSAVAAHAEAGSSRTRGRLAPWHAGAVVACLIFAGLGWFLVAGGGATNAVESSGGPSARDAVPVSRAVAVLPFANLSPDSNHAFFSDGITDDVLISLAKIADLRVIGRMSTARYEHSQVSLLEIGRQLRVSAILQGSVQRQGDRVRIRVQLTDARTGDVLWADVYDRTLSDIFEIQSEIAVRIAGALDAEVPEDRLVLLRHPPTHDLTAYDYYLKGREHFFRATPDDNERALALFRQAVEIDSNYAPAYAGLANTLTGRVIFGGAHRWLDSAATTAKRALRIEPRLWEGEEALGLAYLYMAKPDSAAAAYQKAVHLAPNSAFSLMGMAAAAELRGRLPEMISWGRRAVAVEPQFGRYRLHVGMALAELDRLNEAEVWFREALAVDPGLNWAHAGLAYLAHRRGAITESNRILRTIDELGGGSLHLLAYACRVAVLNGALDLAASFAGEAIASGPTAERQPTLELAWIRRHEGNETETHRLLEIAAAQLEIRGLRGENYYGLHYQVARLHAMHGDVPAALSELEKAFALGWRAFFWRDADPLLAGLRAEPRYQELLGLSEAARAGMALEVAEMSVDPS